MNYKKFPFESFHLDLRPGEPYALLCALDLIATSDTGSVGQNQINFTSCKTTVEKLKRGIFDFTANERRVIECSVATAVDLLSGFHNEYVSWDELDSDWQNDLRKNVFTYMRLLNVLIQSRKSDE